MKCKYLLLTFRSGAETPTLFSLLVGVTFLLFTFLARPALAVEYILVPGVIGVHTDMGTGVYSLEEIAERLEEKGIPIAIITEHALIRCEYGLFPLRRIVRKAFTEKSLLDYGIENYLNHIARINSSHPKMVIIPGTEVAPFYYWTGSYFKKDLTMHNWHKQFLVIGLNEAQDFKNLPMVSNPFSAHYTWKSIYLLWPFLPLLLGIWLIRKRRVQRLRFEDRLFTIPSYPYRILGIIIIILSGLFLFNNFPFKITPYDQYHGDQWEAPYQGLIDYANQRNVLTFWSLPEATTDVKRGGARSYTSPFPESLLATHNYSGFSAFYEGHKVVAVPGGIWDEILKEYCKGQRENPVWAMGEIDYRSDRGKEIDTVQTVFLVSQLNKEAVIDALKSGKIYALIKSQQASLSLDNFMVKDDSELAIMGETLVSNNKPLIQIKVSCPDPRVAKIKVKLIRNGEIIKIFDIDNLEEIIYEDDYYKSGEKIYYRLDIAVRGSRIISNPIFVKFTPPE
ncbi:hypothetical protein KAT51_01445 [bacterium]|nr:hypothetical protein [bacterium]